MTDNNTNKDTLTDMIRESVIVQGAITIIVVATLCYMVASQLVIPAYFTDIASIIIGFYFGAKVQNLVHKDGGKNVTTKS